MLIKFCNRVIEYSFYALFLLVPLVFTSKTSELFELNKMWLTWGLTIVIAMCWLIKMVLAKKFIFQRTPLDIPIGLFLLSQVISTIFSLDSHVSLWGYYSRFNGGLLSTLSYIFLYYAFLSNLSDLRYLRRILVLSLVSGAIVALWGLPSHFGYDPTCLLFRGTLDVSCWTQDFMPIVRIFSTLGQPDWLAAYLAILIPIIIAFAINLKSKIVNPKQIQNNNNQNSKHFGNWNLFGAWNLKFGIFTVLTVLFYLDLLYTGARSGFLGVWISLIFFSALYYWLERKKPNFSRPTSPATLPDSASLGRRGELAGGRAFLTSHFSILLGLFLLITFVIGTPINQLNKFTLKGIGSYFQKTQTVKTTTSAATPAQTIDSGGPARNASQSDAGGTESGSIRLLVWEGALNAWKNNPVFGTGVETFAFAYYKYKPAAHNLVSEWDFLYNKAHNEYLNYLATTGLFGLGTYVIMIVVFLWLALTKITNSFANFANKLENVREKQEWKSPQNNMLILALLSGYISILITNFFGFSVVITNIYLFMIPAFVFVLTGTTKTEINDKHQEIRKLSPWSLTGIFFILIASFFSLITLFRFWRADIAYALGFNLDRAGEYQQAYSNLHKAVKLRGSEPVFKDELSINNAIIAAGLVSQKPKDSSVKEQTISTASALAQEAINTSNEVISQHPNNVVFWKTRTRLFYTLSQVDSRYLPRALDAIEKASLIAPTDAKIWYNLGVLYGQNNNLEKGIEALEKTIILKPDYRDAHYALGLFYHTASLDKAGKVVADENLNKKAIAQMQYILDKISPKDAEALKSISDWSK